MITALPLRYLSSYVTYFSSLLNIPHARNDTVATCNYLERRWDSLFSLLVVFSPLPAFATNCKLSAAPSYNVFGANHRPKRSSSRRVDPSDVPDPASKTQET